MKKPRLTLKRKKNKDGKQDNKPVVRITNQTVAEHREQVIAKARKFKYPIQYTKSKIVRNVSILGVLVIILFSAFSWWQLYKVQTDSNFFYRLTSVIPLPVATVDGEWVRYSDYLLNYKSSKNYLTSIEKVDQTSGASGTGAYDFYKAQAMQNAITETYARKLAKELNINVTDQQVTDAIEEIRKNSSSQGEVSQEVYDRATAQYYGLTPSEYRRHIQKSLVQREVSYAVDDNAKSAAQAVEGIIKANPQVSFDEVVAQTQEKYPSIQVLASGWVKKDNKDGGITAIATTLEKGQVSELIKPMRGDGYYFVRLLDTNSEGDISYELIRVPLDEFKDRVAKLYEENKVNHFITIPDANPQVKSTN